MTLNEIATLCADSTFQAQIRAASIAQANAVLKEVPGNDATVQNKRYGLAAAILADGGVALQTRMVWGIATTPGAGPFAANDTADANDAAIASAMVSQWSTLALVKGAD